MISCRGLRYRYPGGPDLHFTDLDLAQGGVLLLRGRSGAGKSTWLALVAGLLSPTSGDIVVCGQRLAELQGAARDAWRGRTIGYLPQKLHLSEALSVQDNVALAYFAAGVREDAASAKRTLQVLAELGVADLARRRPSQLSGGQAQRVALARAVLLQPQLILADEPSASLDDEAVGAALQLLHSSAARCGASLVIATHDSRIGAALPDARTLLFDPVRGPAGATAGPVPA